MRWSVKIVPNSSPNAIGVWVEIETEAKTARDIYGLDPVPGHPDHHIVQYRRPDDPQDGGPMHASFLSVNRRGR